MLLNLLIYGIPISDSLFPNFSIPPKLLSPPRQPFRPRLGDWPVPRQNRQNLRQGSGQLRDITNDPNRADDPEYIARLIKQVVTVSVETVKIVKGLPELEDTQHEN